MLKKIFVTVLLTFFKKSINAGLKWVQDYSLIEDLAPFVTKKDPDWATSSHNNRRHRKIADLLWWGSY